MPNITSAELRELQSRTGHVVKRADAWGPVKAKARRVPGRMNKTEAAWALQLEAERRDGAVLAYHFEAVTFKVGDDCRYTPDFFVVLADGSIRFDEIKGFIRDDALVKVKVAARMFPWFTFRVVRRVKGAWDVKEVQP